MRNKLLTILGGLGLMLGASDATASDVNSATINTINVVNNFGVISMNGTITGSRASCHVTQFSNSWSIDITTSKGRAILSTATAALLAGKKISITGTTAGGTAACLTLPSPYNTIEQVTGIALTTLG